MCILYIPAAGQLPSNHLAVVLDCIRKLCKQRWMICE